MPNTIAALLKKIKMEHDHIKDSPLLRLPLSLFEEKQYPDLLLILWLYEQKWIDNSKTPKSGVVMGQVSYDHVQIFCSSVKKEVYLAMLKLNAQGSNQSFTITSKPDIWVNPTQVTHYISNNPVFKLMTDSSQCVNELIFFLRWIAHLSTLDKTNVASDWECLKKTGNYKLNIPKLVLTLAQIEPFKNHPNPQSLIYQFLGEINAQLVRSDENNLIHEILRYYQEVLTSLAKKYPPTLEALLIGQGIKIPETLSIELTLLLRMDLNLVPGLTEEQWPELIYYVSLFLFDHTYADRSVLFFTYAGIEIPAALHNLAQNYRAPIQRHSMASELKEANLDLHPLLLSLVCFENCEPLRNLFIMIWRQQRLNVAGNKTIPLIPSPNKFLLGESYYRGPNLIPFKISKHDFILLEKLIVLSKEVLPSDQLLIMEKLPTSQRQGISFFAPGHEMPPHQLEFDTLKNQIEDSVLRESLFINTMKEFCSVKQINFAAITSFLIEHNSEATNQTLPICHDLQQLFEVINDPDTLDLVTSELAKTRLFINLNSLKTLNSQIAELNKSIAKLNDVRESFAQTPRNEEFELRMWWIEIQNRIYTQFKEMALNKVELTNTLQEQREEREGMYERNLKP